MTWSEIGSLIGIILTILGTGASVVGLIYVTIRNFKTDVNEKIDKLTHKMDILDERIFFIITGRNLADVIKEEKLKEGRK